MPFLEGVSYNIISLEDAMELEKIFLRKKSRMASTTQARRKHRVKMFSILLFSGIVGVLSRGILWVYLPTFTRKIYLRKT